MAAIDSESSIWEQIERCESYMVCSMYEEAISLASLVIERARLFAADGSHKEDNHLCDMMESAGMVLVQSMRELGRTAEILNHLQLLFKSVSAIPVEVFLIGVCFQISEGSSSSSVREFLEEFLSSWSYVDQGHYTPAATEANTSLIYDGLLLGVDKYLEVAEVYVLTLLGRVLNDVEHAIYWVENAALPEDRRQDLMRKLHSQYPIMATVPLESSSPPFIGEGPKEISKTVETNGISDGRRTIIELSRKTETCFWWFRTINLKFGRTRLAVSNGKILLGFLIMLACFVLRRKKLSSFQRFVTKQAVSIKKALVDFWKLAFSYQVNPLAAVQPLGAAAGH